MSINRKAVIPTAKLGKQCYFAGELDQKNVCNSEDHGDDW